MNGARLFSGSHGVRAMETLAGQIELTSSLTCPHCGHMSVETMPTDACQYFYDCKSCGALLKPLSGDCCVFCSYGTVSCPPVQWTRRAGAGSGCCP